MGEYATDTMTGERVKIGTCEDLLYLRHDQLDRVAARDRSESAPREHLDVYRFRFPWPDEDGTAPGQFDNPFRSLGVHVDPCQQIEHRTRQFKGDGGYLVMLPCPEARADETPATFQHNGYQGPVKITGQAVRNGNLALICECNGCGATYHLPTWEDAAPVVLALVERALEELKRPTPDESRAKWYRTIADRIRAGYKDAPAEVAA